MVENIPPRQTWEALQSNPDARLVDVRHSTLPQQALRRRRKNHIIPFVRLLLIHLQVIFC